MTRLACSLAALLAATSAFALDPVGGDSFNIETDVDLGALTTENFYDMLVPLAEAEGSFVFYDFTESFKPLFTETIIPAFEAAYDIEVEYYSVDGGTAVQQLIAAKRAGQPSPVDVFFMPNGQVRVANEEGVIANIPLNTALPSAQDLDELPSTVSRGYEHGGVVVPFHRNQTAIGFDTRFVALGEEPTTFDELLAYAEANPGQVAITSPVRGGSGSGFFESLTLDMTTDECREDIFDYNISEDDAAAWVEKGCVDMVIDYFAKLEPVVEFTNGNSDTLTLIANGEAHIGTVWEDMAYDFIGRGLLPPTVKFRLMENGQVGDGDGVMIPAGAQNVASALLFIDFLLSDEMQLQKLELNGSRSARTELDVEGALTPEVVGRLIPSAQYADFARPRISGILSNVGRQKFVEDVLQQ